MQRIKDRRDYAAHRRAKYLARLGPVEDQLTRLIEAIDRKALSADGQALVDAIAAVKADHPKPDLRSKPPAH